MTKLYIAVLTHGDLTTGLLRSCDQLADGEGSSLSRTAAGDGAGVDVGVGCEGVRKVGNGGCTCRRSTYVDAGRSATLSTIDYRWAHSKPQEFVRSRRGSGQLR